MNRSLNKAVIFLSVAIVLSGFLPESTNAQGQAAGRAVDSARDNQVTHLTTGQRLKVRTGNAINGTFEGTYGGTEDGILSLKIGTGEIRLDSLVTADGTVHVFIETGANYQPNTDSISGVIADHQKITIALADVDRVYVTMFSQFGSTRTEFDPATIRDRLKFGVNYPQEKRIPVDSITGLYVLRNKGGKGVPFAIGAAGGLMFGYAVGVSAYESQKDAFFSFSENAHVIPMAILGAVVGGVAFSSMIPGERWEKLSLENINFGIAPVPNSLIGVSVAVKLPW